MRKAKRKASRCDADPDYHHIEVFCRVRKFTVNISKVQMIVCAVLKKMVSDPVEVGIFFVSNQKIMSLNHQYRALKKPTDVLSFPQEGPAHQERCSLGDVVISPQYAKKNAQALKQGLDREVCFLLIHGILHLLSYDHQSSAEAKVMYRKQREIFKFIDALPRPGTALPWSRCVVAVGE